jgi:tetratricopeptide (TPR) repeat protein
MKNMNKKILAIIILLIALAVAAGFFICGKTNKKAAPVENNPSTQTETGKGSTETENTSSQYTKHYTASGTGDYQTKFIEYQDKLEEAVKAFKEGGDKPNPDYFMEKAKYAQYLGHSDWAKEILNDVFTYYDNSSTAWNNLAKLYEEEKNYTKANEYYQKMIDTFGEKDYWRYYYYICENWMYANNKAKTQECYDKYKSFGGSDGQIEDYLK